MIKYIKPQYSNARVLGRFLCQEKYKKVDFDIVTIITHKFNLKMTNSKLIKTQPVFELLVSNV